MILAFWLSPMIYLEHRHIDVVDITHIFPLFFKMVENLESLDNVDWPKEDVENYFRGCAQVRQAGISKNTRGPPGKNNTFHWRKWKIQEQSQSGSRARWNQTQNGSSNYFKVRNHCNKPNQQSFFNEIINPTFLRLKIIIYTDWKGKKHQNTLTLFFHANVPVRSVRPFKAQQRAKYSTLQRTATCIETRKCLRPLRTQISTITNTPFIQNSNRMAYDVDCNRGLFNSYSVQGNFSRFFGSQGCLSSTTSRV